MAHKSPQKSKVNGTKPDLPYMRWWQRNFEANQDVQRMPALSRLMYRSLLQRAWDCKTAPYIPNDDAELRYLADTPDAESWERHKPAILAMLKTTANGEFLYHDKLVGEYDRAVEIQKKHSEGGYITAGKRWHGSNGQTKTTAPYDPVAEIRSQVKSQTR